MTAHNIDVLSCSGRWPPRCYYCSPRAYRHTQHIVERRTIRMTKPI